MQYHWKLGALLSATLLITVACEVNQKPLKQSADAAIVGGSATTEPEAIAKSVVAVVSQKGDGQSLCTGTLLGQDIVLTAAHCVDGEPQHLKIVFNLNIHQATEENVRLADAYVQNERWSRPTAEGRGDLALIHFEGGIPAGFRAVKLAPKTFKVEKGMPVLFAGYGVTNGQRERGAGQLRETETAVVGDYSSTEVLTDGRKHGVCFGDSGGPAFVVQDSKIVQWGIASSVTSRSCNDLSIHTSVMPYLSWIRLKIRDLRGHVD